MALELLQVFFFLFKSHTVCGSRKKKTLPSPVTLTLASDLIVPNWFLASQMYSPSSSSQTPVVKHTVKLHFLHL